MHDIVELRGHNHWDWDARTPPPFQNFEELEVTIGSLAQSGEGLALLPERGDGWVVVVPFVIRGEKVKARVYRHNWGYSHADLVEVIQPAENRIAQKDVLCKYFGTCAGCQLQHISYADQMQFKRKVVENAFKNYAEKYFASLPAVDPVSQSPLQSQYRTKITPHFEVPNPKHRVADANQDVPIGFLQAGKRRILDIEDCPIATPIINEGMKIMRAEVKKNIASYKKGATMLLRESNPVVPGTESEDPPKTTKVCITDHKANITEWVGKFRFDYPAGSFFQNNNAILPSLIGYVKQQLHLPLSGSSPSPSALAEPSLSKPSTELNHEIQYLVDAYCGSGLFGITCHEGFKKVLGVEISAASISCATNNLVLNKLSTKTAAFHLDDADKIFAHIDFPSSETALIIDPPRKGCSDEFLDQMVDFRPARVVYVSCNVQTQARDLQGLLDRCAAKGLAGYKVEAIRGFDLFPQTRHVEGVMTLTRL
ncbi:S-adenosyl-L-methionine-dependent methyltransferase [Gamsiella multidivaricata]|uniref:S-adenosyl-L-methionine-dependent methyltransferase n=1 Tax=Gamsiella multidivaricata TaxID=101098 RepID=UPI00221F110B|nr:S-adenosyl-L-methionine-dependent methyltransferase [Gamsiella multidivaricata]KAI7815872.1 S-adenosyl-L-methionine-dependent methyltransferase [Gamsiella multidivaricata]